AMRAEDRHRARRHLVDLVDVLRALRAQPLYDVAVVHDLVTHVDRRTIFLKRPLDDLDRPFDPGTKPSGLGKHHSHHLASCLGDSGLAEPLRRRNAMSPIPATLRASRAMLRPDAAIPAEPGGGGILPLCRSDRFV